MSAKLPKALIGAAGEYLVAAELSQRGWLATVTIKNAPGTDVLAQHHLHKRVIAIQSKTTGGETSWLLSKGEEVPPREDNEWVVLVRLSGATEHAQYWIIPRSHVSLCLWVGHREWLTGTKSDGTPRRDSSMRQVFATDVVAYLERWDLLDSPTTAVDPALLPTWAVDGARDPRVGLRTDHPLVATLRAVPIDPG